MTHAQERHHWCLGKSITVGFEDLTGGGDRDYEDVVFMVETFDSPI
jgi:hypothetical protein